LATYNEKDNLPNRIAEIQAQVPQAHVLVIDDNSPDGTGAVADTMAAKDPRVKVIHRAGKLGLGTAILTAMKYAMEHGYDYHINMDADFSHPPSAIPALLSGMNEKDVMIGSRYVAGGGTENWPLQRQMISKVVNLIVKVLFGMPVKDASGAYRCYRVSLLRQANLERVKSRGYSFQQEVLFRCFKAGARLGESPILFANRRAGSSKVNWKESVRSLSMILYIGIRNRLGLEGRRKKPEAESVLR
jgi:dolichol-phosphate mannosyltransferase